MNVSVRAVLNLGALNRSWNKNLILEHFHFDSWGTKQLTNQLRPKKLAAYLYDSDKSLSDCTCKTEQICRADHQFSDIAQWRWSWVYV